MPAGCTCHMYHVGHLCHTCHTCHTMSHVACTSLRWRVPSPFSVAHPLNDNAVLISDQVFLLGVLVAQGPVCPSWTWCHVAVVANLRRRGPQGRSPTTCDAAAVPTRGRVEELLLR